MRGDYWLGDYPEPTEEGYPEPTEEDYCIMGGHEIEFTHPETLWTYCRCGQVCEPFYAEPHDEYSAYRADLIDDYVARLITLYDARPFPMVRERLIFEVRSALRNETPDYLLRLIASLKASTDQLSIGDWSSMSKEELDSFVAVGMHFNLDGTLVLRSIIHQLNGDPMFFASDYNSHIQTPMHVLDNEDDLAVLQSSMKLYSLLIPNGRGTTWQNTALSTLSFIRFLLAQRPDMVPVIAAIYNKQGYSSEVTERVMALIDSEPMPTTLADGFL